MEQNAGLDGPSLVLHNKALLSSYELQCDHMETQPAVDLNVRNSTQRSIWLAMQDAGLDSQSL